MLRTHFSHKAALTRLIFDQNGSLHSPWVKHKKESYMVNKTQSLQIRLTADENAAFKKLANDIGVTRARLARKLFREAINNEIDLLIDEELLLKAAIRQLTGVANNLNQVTKALHAGLISSILDEKELLMIIRGTIAARNELISIIRQTIKREVNSHEL
jgi:hypothetical protein